MSTVAVCDCTLQVGGKAVDWEFGSSLIHKFYKTIAMEKNLMMELGYIAIEPYSVDRPIYNRISKIKTGIEKESACSITHIINKYSDLRIFDDEKARNIIVRIQFKKEDLEYAVSFSKALIVRGYRISIHPLNAFSYCLEEYRSMVAQFQFSNAYAFYFDTNIVPQRGMDQVFKYIAVIDEMSSLETKLGLSLRMTGNERVLGEVCAALWKHNLIADIVCDGLGDGSLGISYSDISIFCGENLEAIKTFGFNAFNKFYTAISPSFKIGRELTLELEVAPDYARYLCENYSLEYEDLKTILKAIPELQRLDFDKKTSDRLAYECLKKKYGMAVVVVTANRPKAIEYWLWGSAKAFLRYGIDIIIYDSSNDDKTENIVMNYNFDHCYNVKYKRYLGTYDGFSIDEKVISAYSQFASEYKYLWLHRDGLVPIPDVLMPELGEKLQQGLDAVVINTTCRDYLNIGNQHYAKPQDLFEAQCIQMTILGATIIRSDLIRQVIQLYPLDENTNYSLWQPIALFQYWSDKTVNIDSVVADIWSNNPWAPSSSFWKKNTFKQWCELWYRNITGLPSPYNSCKEKVLKVRMSDFLPFSAMNLLAIRSVNGFNFKYVRTNRQILEKVAINPYWVFCIIACMPRSLAGFLETHSNTKIIKLSSKIYITLKSVM